MNNQGWLKFIERSTEAHHIREIFNGTYALISDPFVQEIFFSKINELLLKTMDGHTRDSLNDLKEDIELEVEHGAMMAAAKNRKRPVVSRVKNTKNHDSDTLKNIVIILDSIKNKLVQVERILERIEARNRCQDSNEKGF